MTKQKYKKLLNPEINETLVFCGIFGNFTPLTRIAKLFTVPYTNTITNRASISSDEVFTS